jgi:DNA-binding IscR family transcriptional regulator
MQLDARLSRMLHISIHMDPAKAPVTSELAGKILDTNPVVVRRMMAGLRDAGHVVSVKGHGGGWTLRHGLDRITMLDVYRAVGEPCVLSIGWPIRRPRAWWSRRSTPAWRRRCRKHTTCSSAGWDW